MYVIYVSFKSNMFTMQFIIFNFNAKYVSIVPLYLEILQNCTYKRKAFIKSNNIIKPLTKWLNDNALLIKYYYQY